jgi:TatD DNase family protein
MTDSHCHLADEAFDGDLDAVIARARSSGVDRALCVLDATKPAEATRAAGVAASWPMVRFAVGVHPHQAGVFADRFDDVEAVLRTAIEARSGTCAVGEIGLDYHYDFASRAVQQEVFRRQVRVAREFGHPIVIHAREAEEDILSILTEKGAPQVSGVFHCFTGAAAMATRAVELGFHVSFSGIVTFKAADSVREAAAVVPADRLLVETDAPYLAPVPHRGKRNEPAWVEHVVDTLAQVRGVAPDDLREQTAASFETLFLPEVSG